MREKSVATDGVGFATTKMKLKQSSCRLERTEFRDKPDEWFDNIHHSSSSTHIKEGDIEKKKKQKKKHDITT